MRDPPTNARRYKGKDLDPDGDGQVSDADTVDGQHASDLGASTTQAGNSPERVRPTFTGRLGGTTGRVGWATDGDTATACQIGGYGSSGSFIELAFIQPVSSIDVYVDSIGSSADPSIRDDAGNELVATSNFSAGTWHTFNLGGDYSIIRVRNDSPNDTNGSSWHVGEVRADLPMDHTHSI